MKNSELPGVDVRDLPEQDRIVFEALFRGDVKAAAKHIRARAAKRKKAGAKQLAVQH